MRLTQQELASRIGARREKVNGGLAGLRRQRLVECPRRGCIVVPEPERLIEEVANIG